ncbi:hypothetical protein CHLNCDRAFT_143440 [Chlorella variabilis]|uniref:FAS1 domain-containing protein n=1 Tax=Chlorella variabilis TaxID=554065 RepID=E1ZAX1_CHLVA|nr:hypothetical protein CHLNCDRAFT_143440 [Chlorella variabilis]EFN56922.1 hypothetical protein CHLNCDRAFT_143440 [Chlorella variabilis]|eukprot:XP_005849024.1 hypothetical protein CHLNCDRAFT_143440 [Chlorella variabilis]
MARHSAQSYDNIGELLDDTPKLSILKAALEAAGLDELASDDALEATLFAPTDKAFADAITALNLTAEEVLGDKDLLTTVLSYHVIPGVAVEAAALEEGQILQTILEGAAGQLKYYTFKGLPRLRTTADQVARITETDISAGKAIVHLIDAVLIPGDEFFSAPAPGPSP